LIFQKARVTTFDAVPSFTYAEESIAAVARRVSIAILGLMGPAMAIGWLGLVRLRRYPIVG
jgi:hypothetical protein